MPAYEFDCEPGAIFELLCDPDFVVDRSLALGDLESECEVYEEGDCTVVTSRRQVERDLPAFLKKVFDPVQRIELTEKWREDGEGGYRCEQRTVIDGVPLTLAATIELYPTEDGCCYSIDQRAKAKIPLIAGRLEKFALGQADEGVEDDMRYLGEYLG